jgi:hypothetical protein
MSISSGYVCVSPKRLTVRLSIGPRLSGTTIVLGYGEPGPDNGIVIAAGFEKVWPTDTAASTIGPQSPARKNARWVDMGMLL